MIFGERCFWRPTAGYPRVLMMDARILLFVALAIFNLNILTVLLLLFLVGVFLVLAWQSIRLESALRMVRLLLLGRDRPATNKPLRQPRNYIQYGKDGRWCPVRLKNIPFRGRGLMVVVLIFLPLAPDPGSTEMYWQGLAPFHERGSEAESEELIQPSPSTTTFLSPAPVNPDWHRNCLLPALSQSWCQPSLLPPIQTLPPLAGQQFSPIPLKPPWPQENQPAGWETGKGCFRVVREGDTLYSISLEAYGNPGLWPKLAEANDLEKPWIIHPGQCLREKP